MGDEDSSSSYGLQKVRISITKRALENPWVDCEAFGLCGVGGRPKMVARFGFLPELQPDPGGKAE